MGDKRFGNFAVCCRLCLSEQGSLNSIFNAESVKSGLADNIYILINVEIKEVDKLSTMICNGCVDKVNNFDQFKKLCFENQEKLLEWMNTWNTEQPADVSIQIKDEILVDDDNDKEPPEVIIDDDEGFLAVKAEPRDNATEAQDEDMEVDFDDMPPPLTPHPLIEEMQVISEDEDDDGRLGVPIGNSTMAELNNTGSGKGGNPAKCSICDKMFSSVGNRKKHEKTIHGRKGTHLNKSVIEIIEDDRASTSSSPRSVQNIGPKPTADPQNPPTTDGPPPATEPDIQKIEFAAGLQLQRAPSANQKEDDVDEPGTPPNTPMEFSYMRKCKAMAGMLETLVCACHNQPHGNLKRLLTHLRSLRTWFPVYTCYSCVITYTDRSTYMRHYGSCPKPRLHNIYRLASMTKNTSTKIRVYHSYRCTWCKFLFSFYEDFCEHICLEHVDGAAPHNCHCGKVFESTDDYKKHVSKSCFVEHYCDVCFEVFTSLDAFRVHCVEKHDNSEGFVLEADDNYRQRKGMHHSLRNNSSDDLEEYAPELKPEVVELETEEEKVINPHAIRGYSTRPTACTICGKVYSNYHNMLRHFKVHSESEKALSCGFCTEKFRLVSELKEHERTEHNVVNGSMEDTAMVLSPAPDPARETRNTRKICAECGKQFATQLELDQHRSVHLNIKVYRDSKTSDYKSTMIRATLVCDICDKSFVTKSELHEHQQLHEKMPVLIAADEVVEEKKDLSKKYSCDVCNKNYLGYGGLWEHNKKHHPGRSIPREYPRKCNFCDKVLQSGGSWYMHKQMHQRLSEQGISKAKLLKPTDDDESYFNCKRCFKVFSNKYNLKNHMKSHGITSRTGKVLKTFWCDLCHQACQGVGELQRHKREHTEENLGEITEEVDDITQRNVHIFACDICNKLFNTKFALKAHKERHDEESGPEEKRNYIYCKYCKIPFQDVKYLEEHMADEHEESMQPVKPKTKHVEKKYPCSVCKKVFDTSGALCSHQGWHKRGKVDKRMRTQEKMFRKMVTEVQQPVEAKYQCHTCSSQFANDTALQIHILETHRNINTTILPARCTTCDLDFDSQAAYDKHLHFHKIVEQKKEGGKPYPCRFCSAAFSRGDTLNAHIRQFHREYVQDNFTCHLCDRAFEKQNALTIHLKVHERQRLLGEPPKQTNKSYYSCSICNLSFAIAKDLRNHVISEHPF